MGLNQTQMSLFMLFGTALGAFFYWTLGIAGALTVDALGYAGSAILMASSRIDRSVRLPHGESGSSVSIWRDFVEGIQYVRDYPLLRAVILGFFFLGIVNGGFQVIPLFMMKYRLAPHDYEAMFAVNGMLSGGAVLLGSVLAPGLSKRMPLYSMFVIGFLIGGIVIALEAFSPSIGVFLALDALFFLTVPMVNVPFGAWLPQLVAPERMGRVDALIAIVDSIDRGDVGSHRKPAPARSS